MICFIPAWYAENEWTENEQIWYTRRMHTEVDDTVKQLQLFDRKSEFTSQTLLLHYAPNYRHFLHRQGLLHSKYWSLFDVIQNIKVKRPAILSFHDLAWPENVEFIYSPFDVIAMRGNEKYATIEFGEDGNMIQIDLFQGNELRRRNIYDDRGFMSSTTVFREGKWSYRQYLDEKGIWRICQYSDGHVDVNSNAKEYSIAMDGIEYAYSFKKQKYDTLEEVIEEVFANYVKLVKEDNIYCVAMHPQHSLLLSHVLKDKKTILSFYNDRCYPQKDSGSLELVKQAKYIIANSKNVIISIGLKDISTVSPVIDITPFDSRVDFGNSLQIKEQNILVTVDHLEDEMFEKMIVVLMQYMQKNSAARVNLFTRNATWNMEDQLLTKTQHFLEKNGYSSEYAIKEMHQAQENQLEEPLPILFVVRQCVDELSVSKCLREQRIVVDMELNPDLFLQISAISMGVPQIVRKQTDYVIDGKNGRVVQDIPDLEKVLGYYLDTLKHWNEAMIESYEIGKKFTSDSLVKQWEGVIAYVQQS